MKSIIKLISAIGVTVLLFGYSHTALGSDPEKTADLFPTNSRALALAQALTDTDPYVRANAAWELGKLKPLNEEEVNRALTQALTDTDPSLRSNAAWALGEIKPSNEEIHMVLAQTLTDTDWSVRANAALALEQIKPKSLEVLEVIKTHDPNLHQRILAN